MKFRQLGFHLLASFNTRACNPRGLCLRYHHYHHRSGSFCSSLQRARSGVETDTMTIRRSARMASSSPRDEAGKLLPAVKKKKTVNTTTKSNSKVKDVQKDPAIIAPPQDSVSASNSLPWYHVFTKGDEEYNRYMATEWGYEKRGMVPLFEKISLEGAQSGLSWLTILRKRDAYRRVFYDFDIEKVASMTTADIERILAEEDKANPRNIVVRHRGKVESVINNAKCIQKLLEENSHSNKDYFDEFLWSFVYDKPILNTSDNAAAVITQSKESQAMSKALRSLGFKFVGPTTMYALMQSCGMVIDHPLQSPEWNAAVERLKHRPGGFQEQTQQQEP